MIKRIYYLIVLVFMYVTAIHTQTPQHVSLANKVTGQSQQKKRADISFMFHDEELVDIINMLASKKGVNVVLPTGANAIKAKVNLNIEHKLTLDEAWDMLYSILDIAGYSIIPKKNLYVVVKNDKNVSRESLPIYINIKPSDLPETDKRIRYMYYLSNIKASQEFDNQLGALFKEFLPENTIYKADKASNGILLIAKAKDVRSLMQIVEAMDQTGFQERLEVVRLRYTTANTLAKLFNENILKTAAETPANRFRAQKEQPATFFSRNVKVIPEPRTNSLVVLGRVQAVERIKDFIFKYIDVQLDSGKSVLHLYELQYLDADEFAPVLQNIVESSRTGGTGQAEAGGSKQTGTERFFEQVIIQPDSPGQASEAGEEGKYFGGNKLIVAARNDDWNRIRKLIEKLDKPQPQVIIEVLIADLTLDDQRRLGSISRNPKDIPFPGEVSAQSAMINQVILDSNNPEVIDTLRGVNSDLNSQVIRQGSDDVALPATLLAGTSVISISDSDGRTWSITEILKIFNNTKILSHPHIIATNNQKAFIEVGETRLVQDQAAPSTSGITRRKKKLNANTNVSITPRISTANTVNLQVVIDIDEFSSNNISSGNRRNRDLTTNASIKSGDILALGGLVRETTIDQIVRTPILSKIPILGWFFKRKNKQIDQTSLTIFISPTIVQPKLRGGIGKYTREYVEVAKGYSRQGGLFDNLRDPVTRWFFQVHSDAIDTTEGFIAKDETTEVLHEAQLNEYAQEEAALLDQDDPEFKPSPQHISELKDILATQENPLLSGPKDTFSAEAATEAPANARTTDLSKHNRAQKEGEQEASERRYAPEQEIKNSEQVEPKQKQQEPKTSPSQEQEASEQLKQLLGDTENPLSMR